MAWRERYQALGGPLILSTKPSHCLPENAETAKIAFSKIARMSPSQCHQLITLQRGIVC
jgi:hypothetical protein